MANLTAKSYIILNEMNQQCLIVGANGRQDGPIQMIDRQWGNDKSVDVTNDQGRWQLIPAIDNTYMLKNLMNHQFLGLVFSDGGEMSLQMRDEWRDDETLRLSNKQGRWNLVPSRNGTWIIKNAMNGKCLIVSENGRRGGPLQLIDCQWGADKTVDVTNDQGRWRLIPSLQDYILQVRHSGKVMAVGGSSQDNGAGVIQWSRLNIADQIFRISLVDVCYRIEARHSGKALAVGASNMGDGAAVVQWTWNNIPDQEWKIIEMEPGVYRFEAAHSQKVLAVSAGGGHDGAGLIQWGWNGGNEQKFRIIEVGNGYVKIEAVHSGKVVAVGAGATHDGANVIQWSWNGGNEQQFKLIPCNYYYRIEPKHSGKTIGVGGSSFADGAVVVQWEWLNISDQKFRFTNVENSYFKIEAKHSGKALAVASAYGHDGANLIQWGWNGGREQQFRLIEAPEVKFSLWAYKTEWPPEMKPAVPAEHTWVTGNDKKYWGCPGKNESPDLWEKEKDGTWRFLPEKLEPNKSTWLVTEGYGDSSKANAMSEWGKDKEFTIKIEGIDPNEISKFVVNYAGIVYGLHGVCHQMANRVALPCIQEVGGSFWDVILKKKTYSTIGSYLLYGTYGTGDLIIPWAAYITNKIKKDDQPYLKVFNAVLQQATPYCQQVRAAFDTRCKELGLAPKGESQALGEAGMPAYDMGGIERMLEQRSNTHLQEVNALLEGLAGKAALPAGVLEDIKGTVAELLRPPKPAINLLAACVLSDFGAADPAATQSNLSQLLSMEGIELDRYDTQRFVQDINDRAARIFDAVAHKMDAATFERVFGFSPDAKGWIIDPRIFPA